MATKIRNVELLTLARSDAGTPVLGHVGVGIDANLIQDFEMGLSRVSSAAQFNLALNVEGATTNTAHYGGIAFTQGASADTVMASIKAVNTSVDGYIDLSFNTRSVTNVLYIKADGKVGVKKIPTTYALEVDGDVQATNFRGAFIGNLTGNVTGTVSTLSNHDTDDLSEGSSNLYFTNERAQDAIGTMLSGNTETLITVTYDDSNNEIDFVVDNDLSNYSNTSSAFITLSSISVTDSGGDGSLAYNNSTGVITYTGPSASDVRAHFSAGTGVGISSGEISIGQAVATNSNVVFNQVTAALVGNASTATTLETARNIVVGKSVAGAGDIDAITQSFNGGANISFDSELNSHLPSNLRATTSSNIADEPSNNAVKIIGSDINTPRLKINRQGLIVGFEEVATSGGGGSGGISALTLNTNGLLYLNSGFTSQTETTSTSTPALNLYLNAAGLFTALTESSGTMSMTIGGTTKTLDLPNTSFTLLALSGNTLQVQIGDTLLERPLDGLSVASATNATNTTNINVAADGSNATRYLNFVDGTSGNRALKVDANLTYNPSTNTLATTTFSGALSGNATTSSGLLIGSTVYVPSSDANFAESLVLRNSSNEVSIAKLILSNNTTASNLDVIVGKISGSDTLHEFSSSQVRTFLGNSRFLPTPSSGVYNITVSNATSATSASNATTATRLLTTANGVVKTINSNGTLSIGSLSSGDIPNNAADTSGNAATATEAGGLTSGTDILPASFVGNSTNTIVARGTSGAISVGAVSCTSISASANITSTQNMQAQKIVLTNSADSLQAKDIRPYGTAASIPGASSGAGGSTFSSASVFGSTIGASNNAFDTMFMNRGYFYRGVILLSDQRVKENISQSSLGLNFVRLLEPVEFNMRGSSTPRVYQGVIAQEVESALEELGANNSAITNIIDYDHDGDAEENEQKAKALDNTQIMWVLFNAVKQLDAEVQDLKKQLEEK